MKLYPLIMLTFFSISMIAQERITRFQEELHPKYIHLDGRSFICFSNSLFQLEIYEILGENQVKHSFANDQFYENTSDIFYEDNYIILFVDDKLVIYDLLFEEITEIETASLTYYDYEEGYLTTSLGREGYYVDFENKVIDNTLEDIWYERLTNFIGIIHIDGSTLLDNKYTNSKMLLSDDNYLYYIFDDQYNILYYLNSLNHLIQIDISTTEEYIHLELNQDVEFSKFIKLINNQIIIEFDDGENKGIIHYNLLNHQMKERIIPFDPFSYIYKYFDFEGNYVLQNGDTLRFVSALDSIYDITVDEVTEDNVENVLFYSVRDSTGSTHIYQYSELNQQSLKTNLTDELKFNYIFLNDGEIYGEVKRIIPNGYTIGKITFDSLSFPKLTDIPIEIYSNRAREIHFIDEEIYLASYNGIFKIIETEKIKSEIENYHLSIVYTDSLDIYYTLFDRSQEKSRLELFRKDLLNDETIFLGAIDTLNSSQSRMKIHGDLFVYYNRRFVYWLNVQSMDFGQINFTELSFRDYEIQGEYIYFIDEEIIYRLKLKETEIDTISVGLDSTWTRREEKIISNYLGEVYNDSLTSLYKVTNLNTGEVFQKELAHNYFKNTGIKYINNKNGKHFFENRNLHRLVVCSQEECKKLIGIEDLTRHYEFYIVNDNLIVFKENEEGNYYKNIYNSVTDEYLIDTVQQNDVITYVGGKDQLHFGLQINEDKKEIVQINDFGEVIGLFEHDGINSVNEVLISDQHLILIVTKKDGTKELLIFDLDSKELINDEWSSELEGYTNAKLYEDHLYFFAIDDIYHYQVWGVNLSDLSSMDISKVVRTNQLEIHPNPSSNIVHFETDQNVEIYSESGILIRRQKGVKSLDIGWLNAGLYFIVNDRGESAKLIKY